MIFDFLKKQKKIEQKKKLAKVMFLNMQIPDAQKSLYIQALDILDEDWVNKIYDTLTNFVNDLEIKELDDIQKNNFSIISGMKKKEAEERKKEINSFNFLLNKL